MKNLNPARLGLYASILLTLIFCLGYILISSVSGRVNYYLVLIIAPVLFVSGFLLLRFFLEKFIYQKIRLIYKTIHSYKVGPKAERKLDQGRDMISDVRNEVIEWGREQDEKLEKMKELEVYRREFLGNISHELKTPIFNIQGYISTLLDGGLEDENINRVYLLKAEKSINRMIALVEDLETISQLESNQLQMDIKKFDVIQLASEVIEFLDMKAKNKGVEIFFREDYDKPLMVEADSRRIRQVLINLVDNAIKYSSKQHEGKTKISFFDMDEHILVEVTDNGVGISEHDLPRVFERFYRTDKARSRDQGGSGLGLSIVKHIIEAHHQTIHVRSTPDVGTTFAFTLKKA